MAVGGADNSVFSFFFYFFLLFVESATSRPLETYESNRPVEYMFARACFLRRLREKAHGERLSALE